MGAKSPWHSPFLNLIKPLAYIDFLRRVPYKELQPMSHTWWKENLRHSTLHPCFSVAKSFSCRKHISPQNKSQWEKLTGTSWRKKGQNCMAPSWNSFSCGHFFTLQIVYWAIKLSIIDLHAGKSKPDFILAFLAEKSILILSCFYIKGR